MKPDKYDKDLMRRLEKGGVSADEFNARFGDRYVIRPRDEGEIIRSCLVALAHTFNRLRAELAGTEIRTMPRGWLYGVVGSKSMPLRLTKGQPWD